MASTWPWNDEINPTLRTMAGRRPDHIDGGVPPWPPNAHVQLQRALIHNGVRRPLHPIADGVDPKAVDVGVVRVGIRFVPEHANLVGAIWTKRFVHLLKHPGLVQIPARRTPRGGNLHNGNLALVQDVSVERVAVPLDVNHREIGGGRLSPTCRGTQAYERKQSNAEGFRHALKVRHRPRAHDLLAAFGVVQLGVAPCTLHGVLPS